MREKGLHVLSVKNEVKEDKVVTTLQRVTHSQKRKLHPQPAIVQLVGNYHVRSQLCGSEGTVIPNTQCCKSVIRESL